jgi:hypothetical protein
VRRERAEAEAERAGGKGKEPTAAPGG